jgi:signal peptidase II
VVISIIVVERMGKINTRAEKIFFGMILGGAAGNLIDRYVFGKITDFVDFRVFPVFNVADSFIFVGATLLFIIYFRNRKKTAAAEGAGKPGDTPATPGRDGGIKQ